MCNTLRNVKRGKKIYKFKIVWGRRRRDVLFIYFFFVDLQGFTLLPRVFVTFRLFKKKKCLTDNTRLYIIYVSVWC